MLKIFFHHRQSQFKYTVACLQSLWCMYILFIQLLLLSKLRTIVVLLSVVCCCLFVCLFIICVKKAMLGYMSYCASLGHYISRLFFQRGTDARLAGSYSPSTGNPLYYGRLAIVVPAYEVELISYFRVSLIKRFRYGLGFLLKYFFLTTLVIVILCSQGESFFMCACSMLCSFGCGILLRVFTSYFTMQASSQKFLKPCLECSRICFLLERDRLSSQASCILNSLLFCLILSELDIYINWFIRWELFP